LLGVLPDEFDVLRSDLTRFEPRIDTVGAEMGQHRVQPPPNFPEPTDLSRPEPVEVCLWYEVSHEDIIRFSL
jgi:hypothetical protein